jgi:replication-associated recombination protein RarA
MDTADADPHRPRALSEMAGATDWMRLGDIIRRHDPPHLVVVGPAGIGKSCALRLALAQANGQLTMWLRCSKDPTLRESRDRIKAAARRRTAEGVAHWIVLEHADLLHSDAQAFLRRVIETSMGACRFALEVRDMAAIAEPLLSRTLMFVGPQLLEHEIRAEVLRRAPATTLEIATRLAVQASGNVRWAILQGLGGGNGMLAPGLSQSSDIRTWSDLLSAMEALQNTGTAPRAWANSGSAAADWERPGGVCPWALLASLNAPP